MGFFFTFLKESNGLATLIFDLKEEKVNKLSAQVILEFNTFLDDVAVQTDIQCLIIRSAKPGMFIAGADINEIKDIREENEAEEKVSFGQNVLNKLEELPFPTIAVIQGVCMGGGTELSLACTYRVVSDHEKVQIALPEVKLGIIPGFGGTQRLPRLIGLQKSLPMILSGKSLDGKKAFKINLADHFILEAFFESELLKFALSILQKDGIKRVLRKRVQKGVVNRFLDHTFIGNAIIYSQAKKTILKTTKGVYPAPLAALRAVKNGYKKSLKKGLDIERNEFAKVCVTTVSKQLISLFFLMEKAKKYTGVTKDVALKSVTKAGVLGAGLMGGGIAWLFTNRNIKTKMKDINWQAIQLGYQSAQKIYHNLAKKRRLKPHEAQLGLHRLEGMVTYDGFSQNDIVVEAVIENMDIKKKVLKELEGEVSQNTIIATNTSSLSISEMATALDNPKRFIGMHFFSPVHRMPLVEVIPGENTSDETIASVVNLAKKLKKTPVVVQNCPGFLVNRILIPYVNEAIYCLLDGAKTQMIDSSAEDFGMPIGPLSLADEVGLDVGYKVSKVLEEGYGERMAIPPIFAEMVKDDVLKGKKTGQGFYLHNQKTKPVNPKINQILEKTSLRDLRLSKDDVVDRLILIMVNEAARCIDEGIIESADYLDLAMIMGTGFPPFRGGLCRYADQHGIDKIVHRLEGLEKSVGERFKPAQLLVNMKKEGRNFYN